MKVEGNARGGKKKGARAVGRRKATDLQNTDLVVTVPNEDSSSSRLKPPVSSSQPRKIVRLNRKTGKLFCLLCVCYTWNQSSESLMC